MNNEAIESETVGKYKLEIFQDDDPMNPRTEWDNAGKMICFHRRYTLGDKHNYSDLSSAVMDLIVNHATKEEKRSKILEVMKGRSLSEWRYMIERNGSDLDGHITDLNEIQGHTFTPSDLPDSIVCLPLYLYDHSGISISSGGFSCPWDSGNVGFIYMTPEKIKETYGDLSSESVDNAKKLIESEIKTYDDYLTGNVYGYRVTEVKTCDCCGHSEDLEVDACYGFFGVDDCKQEGKNSLKFHSEKSETKS